MAVRKDKTALEELKMFYSDLKQYQQLLKSRGAAKKKDDLRESLVRRSGKLKPIVVDLTGKQYGTEVGGGNFDFWSEALRADSSSYQPYRTWSLNALKDSVDEAIGCSQSKAGGGVSRYELTSPVYWVEKGWIGAKRGLSRMTRWAWAHRLAKIMSIMITIIMLVAAILAIWQHFHR